MRRIYRRSAATVAFAVVLLAAGAVPAWAHVQLKASTPTDQATLSVAPSTIELVFSSEMEPAGSGIVVTDAAGAAKTAKVTQPAQHRLIVQPEQPLSDGGYLVSWTVRAGDSHPRSGSIGFAVAQAAQALTAPAAAPDINEANRHRGGHVSAAAPPHGGDVPHLGSAEWVGRMARWLSLVGALLGIGVLAFAVSSLTGSVAEVRAAAYWVRRAGLAVASGTIVELFAVASLLHGQWTMGLSPSGVLSAVSGSPFGLAVLMRLLGGVAMLFGAQLAVAPLRPFEQLDGPVQPLPAQQGAVGLLAKRTEVATHRLNVGRSPIALAGAAVVAFSYLFDGHTATAEPQWLVKIADVAHVFGAGVWVGGVAMMAWVLKRRRRRNTALRAGELAIRFSTVASVALVVVAIAGSVLSFSIVESPGDLLSTGFGRLLILKVLAVGAAAAIGGYNHRYVIPALVANPTDSDYSERLRATVRIEAWILVGVIGITAALVGAGT